MSESFECMGLDPRIINALFNSNKTKEEKLKIKKPTSVQSKLIPEILTGADILASARTGSGKTLAYLLPILSKLMEDESIASLSKEFNRIGKCSIKALILVPTKELASQVTNSIKELANEFPKKNRLSVLNLSTAEQVEFLKNTLKEEKELKIVVATPSKLVVFIEYLEFEHLKFFVLDEADFLVSFSKANDLTRIFSKIPNNSAAQKLCISASLNVSSEEGYEKEKSENKEDSKPSVAQLIQSMFAMRKPVVISIKDEEILLKQFYINVKSTTDKYAILHALVSHKVLFGNGKMLIFVNDINSAYSIKLFFEQLSVKAVVLSEDLPVNSRLSIVEQFNSGKFDIIISSDNAQSSVTSTIAKKSHKKDVESGVSRGIDFKGVGLVLNFHVPSPEGTAASTYLHRIGRTARGVSQNGNALSLVTEEEMKIFQAIIQHQKQEKSQEISNYAFDMELTEGFRYRLGDILRSITKNATKNARYEDIKTELLNSEQLKNALDPSQLKTLKHEKKLKKGVIQPHLKHIPDYLLLKKTSVTPIRGSTDKKRQHSFKNHIKKKKDPLKK